MNQYLESEFSPQHPRMPCLQLAFCDVWPAVMCGLLAKTRLQVFSFLFQTQRLLLKVVTYFAEDNYWS